MKPPETFELISNALACDKIVKKQGRACITTDKLECKLIDNNPPNKQTPFPQKIDDVIITGGIKNFLSIIGSDKADIFIQGEATCTVIGDNIFCSPKEVD